MTSALHLMHGRLRTNVFRDEARQKFVTLLEKTVGTKVSHAIGSSMTCFLSFFS